MQRTIFTIAILLLANPANAALSGDSAQGKRLHDANCVGCHDAGVYTRIDRQVQSLAALQSQLNACSHALQKKFSNEEQQNLVKYLNEQFYKFK